MLSPLKAYQIDNYHPSLNLFTLSDKGGGILDEIWFGFLDWDGRFLNLSLRFYFVFFQSMSLLSLLFFFIESFVFFIESFVYPLLVKNPQIYVRRQT